MRKTKYGNENGNVRRESYLAAFIAAVSLIAMSFRIFFSFFFLLLLRFACAYIFHLYSHVSTNVFTTFICRAEVIFK